MPRTPLLRAFARLARDHRWAHELRTTPEAIRAVHHAAESSGRAMLSRRALLSLPFLDPNLLLSYSYPRVGQFHTLVGTAGLRQGSVYFAGEHTDDEFAGYMEGGARSGLRVAGEVLAALGAVVTTREALVR
jgi:hypothetical protein